MSFPGHLFRCILMYLINYCNTILYNLSFIIKFQNKLWFSYSISLLFHSVLITKMFHKKVYFTKSTDVWNVIIVPISFICKHFLKISKTFPNNAGFPLNKISFRYGTFSCYNSKIIQPHNRLHCYTPDWA